MHLASLNVFIALMVGAVYLVSWLRQLPMPSLYALASNGSAAFAAGCLAWTLVLVVIWVTWGLAPSHRGGQLTRLASAGHAALGLANVMLVVGVGVSFHPAFTRNEDRYWYWVTQMDVLGPYAGMLAVAALCMIWCPPRGRQGGFSA